MLPKRWKNAHILLKSQESAQHCWEFKIVLQIRKSAQRNISRHAYFLVQIFKIRAGKDT